MMQNFVYSGGLSGGLLRHIKNEVKSVLNIKESYSMEKNCKNVSKNSHRNFIKRGGGGGGSKAVCKLYKKQETWYWMASLS